MDGLRLALLILGIVVVAVVYFWTARRRRLEREAGEFDRFDAWTNEALDPLAPPDADPNAAFARYDDMADDADEFTQPNLRVSDVHRALGRSDDGDDVSAHDHVVVDADEPTQPNPLASDVRQTLGRGHDESLREDDGGDDVAATPLDVDSAPVDAVGGAQRDARADKLQEPFPAAESTAQAKEKDDLRKIADSARTRVVPQVGSLDDIEFGSQSSGPIIGASDAGAPPVSLDDNEGHGPTETAGHYQPSPGGQVSSRKQPREPTRDSVVKRDEAQQSDHPDDARDTADMVVVLNVMALANQSFDGLSLKVALEGAGLKAGDMQLYHYRTEGQSAESTAIFSALNTVKPGTLDVKEFDGMRTPGIALVLRMHGIERPSEAFELMLAAARRIADELGGQVCDETRSTLTGQALNHLRERITELAFRARAGS